MIQFANYDSPGASGYAVSMEVLSVAGGEELAQVAPSATDLEAALRASEQAATEARDDKAVGEWAAPTGQALK